MTITKIFYTNIIHSHQHISVADEADSAFDHHLLQNVFNLLLFQALSLHIHVVEGAVYLFKGLSLFLLSWAGPKDVHYEAAEHSVIGRFVVGLCSGHEAAESSWFLEDCDAFIFFGLCDWLVPLGLFASINVHVHGLVN